MTVIFNIETALDSHAFENQAEMKELLSSLKPEDISTSVAYHDSDYVIMEDIVECIPQDELNELSDELVDYLNELDSTEDADELVKIFIKLSELSVPFSIGLNGDDIDLWTMEPEDFARYAVKELNLFNAGNVPDTYIFWRCLDLDAVWQECEELGYTSFEHEGEYYVYLQT